MAITADIDVDFSLDVTLDYPLAKYRGHLCGEYHARILLPCVLLWGACHGLPCISAGCHISKRLISPIPGSRHYSTYCHYLLFPSVRSVFMGIVAGRRHCSTSTVPELFTVRMIYL